MAQDDRNHRIRFVYAQLKAIADDLPPIAFEEDAATFNALVDELVTLGYRAEGFKIGEAELFLPVASTGPHGTTYYEHRQVRYGVHKRQVRALLSYFEMVQANSQVRVTLPEVE